MPRTLPEDLLCHPVQGLNLRPGTVADQIGDATTLLVFLRHFGCPFCRETVTDLRKVAPTLAAFPPILFFAQGDLEETKEFFEAYWPEARVVADPERGLYASMGLKRGTFGEIAGLRVWTCAIRAMSKGHFIGKPVGDPYLMPGAFLVQGDQMLWNYPYKHQGDRPDWGKVPLFVPPAAKCPSAE